MASKNLGLYDWSVKRDKEGHRDYEAVWKVLTDDPLWGPAHVLLCPELPAVGSSWFIGSDYDDWAFCWPDWTVEEWGTKGERNQHWLVTQTFSTRPLYRCQDATIENPLLEPPRIRGGNTIFSREATKDKDGKPIKSTSHERLRGGLLEVDDGLPTVSISMNVLSNPQPTYDPMLHHTNSVTLWGYDPGKVKLKAATWDRVLYGACTFYYTVHYEFEINPKGFKRKIPSEGTKCLLGWSPGTARLKPGPDHPKNGGADPSNWIANPLVYDAIDPTTGEENYKNPLNFEVYKDINGENSRVILDQYGRPAKTEADVYDIEVELEEQANLLLLGIPAII
jgi:hypothetical protein